MSAGDARSAFFIYWIAHATDVARNDKWEDCCAPSPAMTRIGCELHTDLSSRGSVTTVAIQVYYVCGRCPQCFFIYWIATPLTWLAMTSGKIGVCPPTFAMTSGEANVVQVNRYLCYDRRNKKSTVWWIFYR